MDTVTLGSKGQVSIPKIALQRLGLEGGELLLVETTPDGAIVLRPAAVYPIEIYSDERVSELLAEDEMPAKVAARVRKALGKAQPPKP
jgi:AbrB family looped-hinge helix DNA binding protein